MGLPYNKLYRWFKEFLTDFKTSEGQSRLHLHDLEVTTKSGYKTVLVPIFRPEHVDVHMAIDEKHMNGKFYTVLSNAKTGKVALALLNNQP